MNRRMTVSGPRGRVRSIAGVALGAVLGVWAHASALAADVPVLLNEIMANNQSVTNSDGTLTDWIELYNPGVQAADLSDCSLTDDTLTPHRWVFPAGATLPSQGFLVVRCDSSAPASTNNGPILNAGFGLKATGGGVYVYSSVANGGALAASVVYGLQA